MVAGVRDRQEWKLFACLPRAARGLAFLWWLAVVLRGTLPAVFTVAIGLLVGELEGHHPLALGLALVGASFVLIQVLAPLDQAVSANLGSKLASHLNDTLVVACTAPPGVAHLEDSELAEDLTVARRWSEPERAMSSTFCLPVWGPSSARLGRTVWT